MIDYLTTTGFGGMTIGHAAMIVIGIVFVAVDTLEVDGRSVDEHLPVPELHTPKAGTAPRRLEYLSPGIA